MNGACITNYTKVQSILFDDEGKACGATCVDRSEPGAEPFEVRAKKIVYAGGPFTDGLRELSEGNDVKPVVNGSGGTHIVLPPYYCPRHMGMVDMMTSRGSFLFSYHGKDTLWLAQRTSKLSQTYTTRCQRTRSNT
jgi:glycerol-3-phosphate dehydrogenase